MSIEDFFSYIRVTVRGGLAVVSVQSYVMNHCYSFTLHVASPVYVHARAKHVTLINAIQVSYSYMSILIHK